MQLFPLCSAIPCRESGGVDESPYLSLPLPNRSLVSLVIWSIGGVCALQRRQICCANMRVRLMAVRVRGGGRGRQGGGIYRRAKA